MERRGGTRPVEGEEEGHARGMTTPVRTLRVAQTLPGALAIRRRTMRRSSYRRGSMARARRQQQGQERGWEVGSMTTGKRGTSISSSSSSSSINRGSGDRETAGAMAVSRECLMMEFATSCAHVDRITSLGMSPSGQTLLSGDGAGKVIRWTPNTKIALHRNSITGGLGDMEQ